MSRWTSADNQTAAAASTVIMVVFADLDIPGDRLRLNDSPVTITWGGFDWGGLGQFGGIDVVGESLEIIAQPVKLTLSGVEPQYVQDAKDTAYHGQAITLYIGLFDTSTLDLIDTPEEIWSGYMDYMVIDVEKNSATITVNCEHRLRRQPKSSRYTDEDQRVTYSTDYFFNKLHLIPQYVGKWGTNTASFGFPSFGDGPGPRRPVQWE